MNRTLYPAALDLVYKPTKALILPKGLGLSPSYVTARSGGQPMLMQCFLFFVLLMKLNAAQLGCNLGSGDSVILCFIDFLCVIDE